MPPTVFFSNAALFLHLMGAMAMGRPPLCSTIDGAAQEEAVAAEASKPGGHGVGAFSLAFGASVALGS